MAKFLFTSSLLLLVLIVGIRLTRGQGPEADSDRQPAAQAAPKATDSPPAAAEANTPPAPPSNAAGPPATAEKSAGASRAAMVLPGPQPAAAPRAERYGAPAPSVFPLPPALGAPLPTPPLEPNPAGQSEAEAVAGVPAHQPNPIDGGGLPLARTDQGGATEERNPPARRDPPEVKAPEPKPPVKVDRRPGRRTRQLPRPASAAKAENPQASQWEKAQESWNNPGRP